MRRATPYFVALALTLSSTASAETEPACAWLMGDINRDGVVDVDDSKRLLLALFDPEVSYNVSVADMDRDGRIDLGDFTFLNAFVRGNGPAPESNILPGDANGDDELDIADLSTLAEYLTNGGGEVCMTGADTNRDGRIDVADLWALSDEL